MRHPDAPAPGELLGSHYEHCFGWGEAQPHGPGLRVRAGVSASGTAEFTVTPARQGSHAPGPVRRIFPGPRRPAPHLAALSESESESSEYVQIERARAFEVNS